MPPHLRDEGARVAHYGPESALFELAEPVRGDGDTVNSTPIYGACQGIVPLRCLVEYMTDTEIRLDPSSSDPFADWEAIARYLAGESSTQETVLIEALLAERPADRDFLAVLDRAMSEIAEEMASSVKVEDALALVKARRDSAAIQRWRVPFPAMAAAAVAVVGLAGWLVLGRNPAQPLAPLTQRMLATGVGVRDSLDLPDGTRVVLGPLSSVTVAAGYGGTAREVSIRGNAWFDVVHDADRPFTVHAGSATIVDVGTRFAVRSDASAGVAVSVMEGSVSLRAVNTPARQGVILQAGDNGLLKTGGEVVARRGTVVDDDVAWLSGRLVLREATINEVKAAMRSWYGLELRVADPSLANRHITATFKGESADRVLDVLGLVLGAEIERRGDTAIVHPAKGSVR